MNQKVSLEVATLAGGFLWCIEAVFREIDGMENVVSGYTGDTTVNTTCQRVYKSETGHAEAAQVSFNPSKISYREILEIFFSIHDPTTLNRQGADVGTQYRSAIFYHSEEQKAVAEELIRELDKAHLWSKAIMTEIVVLDSFYPAEDYQRVYFSKHPEQAYCQMVISPKVSKFRKQWTKRLKSRSRIISRRSKITN